MTLDDARTQRQLEAVQRWITYGCLGIYRWATGVGKTYGAILTIERIEKSRHPIYMIVVPSFPLKEQWERVLSNNFNKFILDRIIIITTNTLLLSTVNYEVDVLIVDEIHEFTTDERFNIINNTRVKYKACLGLTAEGDAESFKRILSILPIIDHITEEEARQKQFISDFIEYNLEVPLSGFEKEEYDKYSEIISAQLPKFDNNLQMAQRCLVGGKDPKTKKYFSAISWATAWAMKKGYRDDLNPALATHQEIISLWAPQQVIGYAKKLIENIRHRKNLLNHCASKITTISEIIDKFDKVKTIVFSESTSFADTCYETVRHKHKAVVYHSNLATVIRQSEKSGKPIKVGKQRLKKEATEAIISGKARIIFTSKALDRGFNVVDLRLGITASGTQNPEQYNQRGGRVKRKEVENIFSDCTVLLINLYVKDTKDEVWLKKRQINTTHKIYNVKSIDDITYVPPSNIEYEVTI